MSLVNFKRIIQPSLVQNDKDSSYLPASLPRETVKSLLSAPLAGGGVFGVEAHIAKGASNLVFFAPPYYKTEWTQGERDPFFERLEEVKDLSIMQLYTKKSSLFPLLMHNPQSFWEQLQSLCAGEIGIAYQVALAYRQDNWKERLQEQYDDYLNGIETPADTSIMRRFQRQINSSLDNFLKWDFQYAPIPEVETKLEENGFRYSIRILLYGDTKHRRRKMVKTIQDTLRSMGYINEWNVQTHFIFDDIIQNIKHRKIDNVGKQQVLSVSELLPFLMSESVVHIETPTIVGKLKKDGPSSNPFHLLPMGNPIEQKNGEVIAKKFIYALQELGKLEHEIVAKRTQCGPTMMKMTFDLPKGLKLSELTKKNMIEDIQTHMGIKNLRITQGESVGEIDVWLAQEERQKIFLRNYVDTPEFMEFADKYPLPFFVGVDEIGRPIFKCLTKIRHILVAGTTGSGKSVWMNQLILTLLVMRRPEELQFYMIDVKQVELPIYETFPHVHPVITEADEAIKVLKRLIEEMNRRYSLFKYEGVKNIALYNKKVTSGKLPYIVCIIDEYAELALRTDEVHDLVQSMSQLARAAGIHLVIATQDPRVEVIPGIIKSNLPGKIGFRCSNGNSYMTFLNTKPPFNLLGNGDGTMSFEGQIEEHIRFQGCLIIDDPHDDDLESELIKRIATTLDSKSKIKNELPPIVDIVENTVEPEIDRLKGIIARTGETRVSQLREIMKININRLNDLMKELVEEEWLSKPESKQSGYQLIAKEEELEKHRS